MADRGPVFDGVPVGRPATGALIDAGYRTVADLPEDLSDLLSLHGVGPSAIARLDAARSAASSDDSGPAPRGSGRSHPGVDAYLAQLPPWQRSICEQLRAVIRATDPEIEETVKRTVQPYFVLRGNVCALLATKDHVNLFLYDPTVSDPSGVINQGHGNATGRAIQVYEDDVIDEEAVSGILAEIVANNRKGGWRRLKAAEG